MTAKQQKFIQEYLLDLNATQAAIRAGYSPASAEVEGHRLLRNAKVASEIASAQQERTEKLGITTERILEELKRIAFADPRNLMSWGPGGVILKESSDLTDEQAAVVAEASESVNKFGSSVKIKTHDKVAALTLLMRHKGLLNDKIDHTTGGQPFKALISVDIDKI